MKLKDLTFWKKNIITRNWAGIKYMIISGVSSVAQKRLNAQKVPRRGLPLENNSIYVENNAAVLDNPYGTIILSPFNRGIFRVYLRHKDTRPWMDKNSWTVDLSRIEREGWEHFQAAEGAFFSYTPAGGQEARIMYDPLKGTVSLHRGKQLLLHEPLAPQTSGDWLLVKKQITHPGTVKVFGLGENTQPMDKAGQRIVMWNTDQPNYKKGTNPLYQSWPVAVFQCSDGPAFGLVFDNPGYSEFDFAPDGKEVNYSVKDRELSYFILLGPTLTEVMEQLSLLTGKLPPLPKWALGYQQSRWSYKPSSQVRDIAAGFRERDIPCDVIYLDIDYMDQFKCFTWGDDFRDYKELINHLHDRGFKIVTIMDPGLKAEPGYHPYDSGIERGTFITDRKGNYVAKRVWAGLSHFPDFINSSARKWWGTLIKEFARCGVDGIWCDMNEPSTFDLRRTLAGNVRHRLSEKINFPHEKVHNVYGFLMSRATYEGLAEITRMPYVITRSTYLGGQKYAVTWTGDNKSNPEHFRAGIPMILNLGLSGQPVAGPDIGGFKGKASAELYRLWVIQGALYPYCRTHTVQGNDQQEPWSFGEEVEADARAALKLRYRLIPYLYSLLYEATQKGQPVMRPLFYHSPAKEALEPENYETQFMLGPHLLAAPMMDTAATRSCYLPPGQWYSWWCGKGYGGGQRYQTTAGKDSLLPLFIGEDAIIPIYPEAPTFIPDRSLKELEIIITARDKAENLIVEYFDGESLLAYAVSARVKQGIVHVTVNLRREGSVPPAYRPPETLYITLNHAVSELHLDSIHRGYSLEPHDIKETWTRATIKNPFFPLRTRFVCSESGDFAEAMAAN